MTSFSARPGTRRPRVARGGRTHPRGDSTGSCSFCRQGEITGKWNPALDGRPICPANQPLEASVAERFVLFDEFSKSGGFLAKCSWRRGWDSNPRAGHPTRRFRGAPVTTTSVPLRVGGRKMSFYPAHARSGRIGRERPAGNAFATSWNAARRSSRMTPRLPCWRQGAIRSPSTT